MSIPWEKSETWRWIVRRSRDSKPFFLAFATICGVVPGVIGYGVMQVTNSRNEQLEAQLRRKARPDSLMMGQANRERLAEFLGELQRKEDINDRYVAALRGETLTRKPYVRIQPIPKDINNNNNTTTTQPNKEESKQLPKK
ncbi:centrosomal protein [Trema orientale]|uniref:Centrosomal protein n=1 Tax=Trema orientale TaxID=63057 RepID=A0A2P5E2Z1_TREOI|nr:centrosomal protein [Trema orientale]